MKTSLVADILHGAIEITPFEKVVISTKVFNRLHNILQNSTLYFTYPSNRTSRFSHSLGCLHITSQIYRHAIINAPGVIRDSFAQALTDEIQAITVSDAFRSNCADLQIDNDLHLREGYASHIDCPLYPEARAFTPDKAHQTSLVLAYQAVRLVALLHDLGHPPFSHVVEKALNELLDEFPNSSELMCLDALECDGAPDKKKGTEGKAIRLQLHEALGIKLSDRVFDNISNGPTHLAKEQKYHKHFCVLMKHIVRTCFRENEKFPSLLALHKIVSGDLDSDRLDFVCRDLVMCGCSLDPLRITRITKLFTLVQHEKSYIFAPSIRALNAIERFFTERFNSYKYAVFHHRAAKFDALLQRCVVSLARKHLKSLNGADISEDAPKKEENNAQMSPTLPPSIEGIWAIAKPQVLQGADNLENYYIAWDDAWLLNVLRTAYFESIHADPSPVRDCLEELLSNAKIYKPLYKRPDEFHKIDSWFCRSLENTRNCSLRC